MFQVRAPEGTVKSERVPHMPAKARLSWRICRLRFDGGSEQANAQNAPSASGVWWATASKGDRVAVIPLPELKDPNLEDAWIAEIEARFEQNASDPTSGVYLSALMVRAASEK